MTESITHDSIKEAIEAVAGNQSIKDWQWSPHEDGYKALYLGKRGAVWFLPGDTFNVRWRAIWKVGQGLTGENRVANEAHVTHCMAMVEKVTALAEVADRMSSQPCDLGGGLGSGFGVGHQVRVTQAGGHWLAACGGCGAAWDQFGRRIR